MHRRYAYKENVIPCTFVGPYYLLIREFNLYIWDIKVQFILVCEVIRCGYYVLCCMDCDINKQLYPIMTCIKTATLDLSTDWIPKTKTKKQEKKSLDEDILVNILFLKMLSDITFEHLVKKTRLIFIRHYYLGMVSVFICSTMFKDESGKKKPLNLSFYVFGVKHHSTRYALNCVCIFDDIRSIENSTCNSNCTRHQSLSLVNRNPF